MIFKIFLPFVLVIGTVLQASSLVGNLEGSLNVSSGKLNYTVPINLPKVKYGLTPALNLSYSQGGGNSEVGLGFSLGGLSKISRCTTTKKIDGIKEGISFNQKDRYCLDGKRLIRQDDGTYSLYTSKDLKVYLEGDEADPRLWRVYDKGGYILTYGASSNSKLEANGVAIKWYITSKEDRLGHKSSFTYLKSHNKIYIDGISFAQYRAKFHYRQRADRSKSYYFGKEVVHDRLLDRIELYANDNFFYRYQLSYESITSNN